MPDINLKEQVINEDNIESVSQIVEDVTEDLEAIASEVIDEIAEYVPEQPTEIIDEVPVIEKIYEPPPPEVVNTAPDPVPPEFNPEQPENTPEDSAISNDLKWHAFWNPFRSKIAATGFVSQLERVTGLDYRVVKIEPGVYDVGIASVNMIPHVDIEGSGEKVTRIVGTVERGPLTDFITVNGVINGANDAELRHLTVVHQGDAGVAVIETAVDIS